MRYATLLRQNSNLPFANKTKADQAKLDAAVLQALEGAKWSPGRVYGGTELYNYCARGDLAIMIVAGMDGVTHDTIDQIAPMVAASCKRLISRGLVVEGARKYARRGRPGDQALCPCGALAVAGHSDRGPKCAKCWTEGALSA